MSNPPRRSVAPARPPREPVPAPADGLDRHGRCWQCKRELFVYTARPWLIECPRCHAKNGSAPV